MGMKHTAGPWRLKESPHKREFSQFIDAGAEVGSYFIAAINNGTGPDDANARLIAAAPELLEAAQWVCRLFGTDHPQGITELKDYVKQLRAAVRKAEGSET